MIGIIILIGICISVYQSFSALALKYRRPNIAFGVLGICVFMGTYFLCTFVFGFLLAMLGGTFPDHFIAGLLLQFFLMGAGVMAEWGIRILLEKAWAKEKSAMQDELLDDPE